MRAENIDTGLYLIARSRFTLPRTEHYSFYVAEFLGLQNSGPFWVLWVFLGFAVTGSKKLHCKQEQQCNPEKPRIAISEILGCKKNGPQLQHTNHSPALGCSVWTPCASTNSASVVSFGKAGHAYMYKFPQTEMQPPVT